jgi:hypothetical protein
MGQGGAPMCQTCGQFLASADPDPASLCEGSAAAFETLKTCACAANACGQECAGLCAGDAVEAGCQSCLAQHCNDDLIACTSDM